VFSNINKVYQQIARAHDLNRAHWYFLLSLSSNYHINQARWKSGFPFLAIFFIPRVSFSYSIAWNSFRLSSTQVLVLKMFSLL
jgi:hypothetical protein